VFSVACGGLGENPVDTKTDQNAVREQVVKYTQALDAADTGIASKVWLTTPEASFISPMGHSHGWEEVKKVNFAAHQKVQKHSNSTPGTGTAMPGESS